MILTAESVKSVYMYNVSKLFLETKKPQKTLRLGQSKVIKPVAEQNVLFILIMH